LSRTLDVDHPRLAGRIVRRELRDKRVNAELSKLTCCDFGWLPVEVDTVGLLRRFTEQRSQRLLKIERARSCSWDDLHSLAVDPQLGVTSPAGGETLREELPKCAPVDDELPFPERNKGCELLWADAKRRVPVDEPVCVR
jgi:hypothetical protein